MTNIQLYKPGTIESQRAEIMATVGDNMPVLHRLIAEAGIQKPIRGISPQQALILASEIIAKIRTMTGIRGEVEPEILSEFARLLPRYHADMTIQELMLAFEMGSQGELDDYLPKNSQGQPDRNHYNRFSIEYATKMIQAFRKKKALVWHEARTSLPAHEEKMSEEQIEQLHQAWEQTVITQFEKAKRGEVPIFHIPMFARNYLQQKGVINSDLQITNESRAAAIIVIKTGRTSLADFVTKMAINDDREGKRNDNIEAIATRIQAEADVTAAFRNLIANKKEITEYL